MVNFGPLGNVKKEPDWLGKFVKRVDSLPYDEWGKCLEDMPLDVLHAYNQRKLNGDYKPSENVRKHLVELDRPSVKCEATTATALFKLMKVTEDLLGEKLAKTKKNNKNEENPVGCLSEVEREDR